MEGGGWRAASTKDLTGRSGEGPGWPISFTHVLGKPQEIFAQSLRLVPKGDSYEQMGPHTKVWAQEKGEKQWSHKKLKSTSNHFRKQPAGRSSPGISCVYQGDTRETHTGEEMKSFVSGPEVCPGPPSPSHYPVPHYSWRQPPSWLLIPMFSLPVFKLDTVYNNFTYFLWFWLIFHNITFLKFIYLFWVKH